MNKILQNEENKYRNTNQNNTKSYQDEENLKIKTGLKRFFIGLVLITPLNIIFFKTPWLKYLLTNKSQDINSIILVLSINLFLFGIFMLSISRKSFIDKEFEDRKLKEGNYKFTFKEQFYRYVKPNTVKRIIIIAGISVGYILLKVFDFNHKFEIIGFLTYFVFDTIWIIYCNAFKGGDEWVFYVTRVFIALLMATLMYIYG